MINFFAEDMARSAFVSRRSPIDFYHFGNEWLDPNSSVEFLFAGRRGRKNPPVYIGCKIASLAAAAAAVTDRIKIMGEHAVKSRFSDTDTATEKKATRHFVLCTTTKQRMINDGVASHATDYFSEMRNIN